MVLPVFWPISKYPSIRRDIAVVVDEGVNFGAVEACVRRAAPKNLQEIVLFDLYKGEKVDSGRKSLAFGLILQESSHTLTDQEVESVVEQILAGLQEELGAQLRD